MTSPADPQLAALAALIGRVAQALRAGEDSAARAAAAASVDELRAMLAGIGRDSAPGFDLAQIGGALAVFADWLRAPTPDGEARAERAMSELQAALGPRIGRDPEREDAARRAQYRREARAALDELFPGPGPAPDKPEPKP